MRLDDRTVGDRAAAGETLLAWEASRLYLVSKVFESALEVFEHEASVADWLGARIMALGHVTPDIYQDRAMTDTSLTVIDALLEHFSRELK